MLHQACEVGTSIYLPSESATPDWLPRIEVIRGQLDALQRDLTFPTSLTDQRERVRSFIAARRNVQRSFGGAIFSDPAWDILVHLYDCQLSQRRVSLSLLSKLTGVAPATAQRWVKLLEDKGHICRTADCFDSRRVWISLTPEASEKMEAFFRSGPGQVVCTPSDCRFANAGSA